MGRGPETNSFEVCGIQALYMAAAEANGKAEVRLVRRNRGRLVAATNGTHWQGHRGGLSELGALRKIFKNASSIAQSTLKTGPDTNASTAQNTAYQTYRLRCL
ncbi:unnamed protein product [Toxocara canis]|uniref:Calpain catalytic domain-containing protein n=1 Tax=Toxocara canis TaxID=6265 RepID=A0A183V7Y0_TOXCA|nr:unnamed protein product [Toxocara canis]